MKSISPRVSGLILILICVISHLQAQERLYSDEYRGRALEGVYHLKSLDSTLLTTNVIDPQTQKPQSTPGLLVVKEQPVILFKNNNPKGAEDVAGILETSSMFEWLETLYKRQFRDRTKEFHFTHEVWKKIRINGKIYYTDYKLHRLEGKAEVIPQFDQVFMLFGQATGYDGNYDIGYPEHFHVMILDAQYEQLYLSKELPVYCNCEFGFFDEIYEGSIQNKGEYLLFIIPGNEYDPKTKTSKIYTYIGKWNGKELTGAVNLKN